MNGIIDSNQKIVANGLILNLDAAQLRSYPTTGTTWTDLSGNISNGTLINTPTFSSNNGGIFNFNGTDEYVSFDYAASPIITIGSVNIWFKTSNAGSSYRSLITRGESWGIFLVDNILITYDWGSDTPRTTGINVANGNWQNVSMTFTQTIGFPSNNAIIYLNGSAVLTTTIKFKTNQNFRIASQNDAQLFTGDIANAQVYNRVLSATEVSQNYNATKSRFGL
jgi:hypothetical protein